MNNFVRLEKFEGYAIVTFDNPPLNILSSNIVAELGEVFTEIENDPDIIVAIFTGSGNKAFIAGADIKEFPQFIGNPQVVSEFVHGMHRVFNQIDFSPKPTIAVVNGMAFGGGCELMLTCDLRIAESHAQFGLPEIKLGLFPGAGGTQRLPRAIGEAKAKELMFTGDPITAQDAEKIGLVNQVVATGKGLETAIGLAKKIAGKSLPALSRIKMAVDQGANIQLEEGIELEAKLFEEVCQTRDIEEGVNAFIEKRKPRFIHK